MSDTPRIKAAQITAMEHSTGDVWRVGCQLERELNAANDCNREIRERNEWLNDKIDAANDRIKRMEEAGDYLCAAAAFMGWHDKIETWNKAKEAKL